MLNYKDLRCIIIFFFVHAKKKNLFLRNIFLRKRGSVTNYTHFFRSGRSLDKFSFRGNSLDPGR